MFNIFGCAGLRAGEKSRFAGTEAGVTRVLAAFLTALVLAGCTVGPDYQAPPEFAEKPAPPPLAETWWGIYQDPALDLLERQVEVSNQTIKSSEAAYRSAVAAADAANALLFPVLGISANAGRAQSAALRGTGTAIGNQFGTSLTSSWAPDLWGSLRRGVESADATQQASAADLAAARLTAQAALAADYFALRAADDLKRLLDRTAEAYAQSLQIARNQYAAGVAARSDVEQALTQLASTRAQAIAVENQRAQLQHAMASLVGKPATEFSVPPVDSALPLPPAVPAAVPSALLQRRPDVAGAERRMAAANAQIGIAEAAYYPNLNLTGSTGSSSSLIGQLFTAGTWLWSVGAQASEAIFDAGARDARVAQARASYDQETAIYRQAVLTALQQVEDQLAALRVLAAQAEMEDQAVASAQEAERLTLNQYKAGTVAYTTVITAQTAALSARQTALTIRQNRLAASVSLMQAMGGGWSGLPGTGATP